MPQIQMSVQELQSILDDQKRMVIEKLLIHSSYYNTESDASNYRTLPIDPDKFKDQGMKAGYPNDFEVLKKYVK